MKGVKYVSYANTTGYGLTAAAYVRALVNAGLPVWWQPMIYAPFGVVSWTPMCSPNVFDMLRMAPVDETLGDLPALINATAQPIDYDVQVVHLVPEYWRFLLEPGKRRVGYTMWEADRLPPQWPAWLNLAERILVPNQGSQAMFEAAGVQAEVHVIPHIRRHIWNRSGHADLAAARQSWRLPAGNFVFYSISAWDPRKAWPDLILAYLAEFSASEPVTLLLKTSAEGPDPVSLQRRPVPELINAIVAAYARDSGRLDLPAISLVAANDLPGREIDLMHQLGDCYTSLSHGECWGLGAFDAATLGKPVIMTGWGGQTDFLGADYPGLVRWQFVPVTSWPGYESYAPPQQWAQSETMHARQLLRWAFTERVAAQQAADKLRLQILNRYAEPLLAQRLIGALS